MKLESPYLFASNTNGYVDILDVSEPSNIHSVSKYFLDGLNHERASSSSIQDDKLFVLGYKGLYIADLSDISNPVTINTFDSFAISNDYCNINVNNSTVVYTSSIGVEVIDISDITSLKRSAHFYGLSSTGILQKDNLLLLLQEGFGVYFIELADEFVRLRESSDVTLSDYSISQNFPNPFNPSTNIKYNLKDDSMVLLEVFNIMGERINELVDEFQTLGQHSVIFDGSNLSSGVNFYRLSVSDASGNGLYTKSNKMLLLK